MSRRLIAFTGALQLVVATTVALAEPPSYADTYEQYVDTNGTIVVPQNYRTRFTFLGTFSVAGGDPAGGQAEFHQVYVDPDAIAYYRRTGVFPDGTIVVKELQKARAVDMTTGHVSSWKQGNGWFVMIKDTEGRFEGNGLWGDGWGWALFDASAPAKPTTTDYRAQCLGCHAPAKKSDWVHVWAYPLLGVEHRFEDFGR